MNGTPDAEAAWREWEVNQPEIIAPYDAFLAGFAAAEGPWREHLAAQIIGELREFLPEWDYPPYVVAAICLELKERLRLQTEQQDGKINAAESEEHGRSNHVVTGHDTEDTPNG